MRNNLKCKYTFIFLRHNSTFIILKWFSCIGPQCISSHYLHKLWLTINKSLENDVLTHLDFCQKFDSKIFIHGNECIILFLTRYFISRTQNSTKNNHISVISPLSLRQSLLTYHCDVTTIDLWRHANVGYWHCDVIFVDCFLHPQIGAKAFFTSE